MKILIVALNSKYIHSALAPWYLKAACGAECGEVCVKEHTINENLDTVLASLYQQKPDIAAFSCYIWNIAYTLKLASSLKKLLPETVIVLGGPEVSYDAGDVLRKHTFIDFVLAGEGEISFPKLLRRIAADRARHGDASHWDASHGNASHRDASHGDVCAGDEYHGEGAEYSSIEGLAYRSGDDVATNAPALIEVLDSIPSPYTDEMLLSLKNKIVYFETSRGCPFSCSYCLSSATEGTRYFSMGRVIADLDRLIAAGLRQIKFVDRTFNFNRNRALTIVKHIIELDKRAGGSGTNELASAESESGRILTVDRKAVEGLNCNFHFEVGADLFDEEMLQFLENAPKGLFQLEAGVQTVNKEALAAVSRKTNLDKLFGNLVRLQKSGSIHVHADLIAGLPHEDYNSFANSFDQLYGIKPHQLQLGFLKLLKGTRLRYNAAKEEYRFNDFPPYEILGGKCISYDELIILKGIAELVERYYNSGRFAFSLEYMISRYFESPFRFFESFYYFNKKNDYMEVPVALRELYTILDSFALACMNEEGTAVLRELLRLDFLASDDSGTLPKFMESRSAPGFNEKCFDYLRDTSHITAIMPEAAGMPFKQLFKRVHFEQFHLDLDRPGIQGDASIKGEADVSALEVKGDISVIYKATSNMVLVFNYMLKDKVSGRYPFYRVNI